MQASSTTHGETEPQDRGVGGEPAPRPVTSGGTRTGILTSLTPKPSPDLIKQNKNLLVCMCSAAKHQTLKTQDEAMFATSFAGIVTGLKGS